MGSNCEKHVQRHEIENYTIKQLFNKVSDLNRATYNDIAGSESVRLVWTEFAKEVALKGSWDEWKEEVKMERSEGEKQFGAEVRLRKGEEYQFKYLVDGQWMTSHRYQVDHDNNVILV